MSSPGQKVGRHWRFHRSAIDDWLRSKHVAGGSVVYDKGTAMTTDGKSPKRSRLVQFIEELVRLRPRTVVDLDSYEEILWLGGMPGTGRVLLASSRDDP